MSKYIKDDNDVVHVRTGLCGDEFTMCGFAHCQNDEGSYFSKDGVNCKGPATCVHCKSVYDETRILLKGLRFGHKLQNPDDFESVN